jgi:hypothetical protein
MQEVTFTQILPVNNRIDNVFNLLHSLKDSKIGNPAAHNNSGNMDHCGFEERLIRLSRFLAINIAVRSQGRAKGEASVNNLLTDSPSDIALNIDDLMELASRNGNRPTRSSGFLK